MASVSSWKGVVDWAMVDDVEVVLDDWFDDVVVVSVSVVEVDVEVVEVVKNVVVVIIRVDEFDVVFDVSVAVGLCLFVLNFLKNFCLGFFFPTILFGRAVELLTVVLFFVHVVVVVGALRGSIMNLLHLVDKKRV